MSMISSQCDELRERATALRQGRWSDGEDDATLMEQAADTIWELREMAQKANAENAELRKAMDFQALELGCMTDNRDVLHLENEKLRELLSDTLMDPQKYCEKYGIEYKGWNSANTHLDARMRELGIEVD